MALTDNNFSYWKLEADGTDSIGSNTLSPGTSPSFSAGKIGNGALFTRASSQFLTTSGYAGSSSYSYNFWYKPTATNVYQCTIAKDDVSTKRIFSLDHESSNDITLYAWGTGQNFHQTTTTASGMSAGTYYMWTVVWDAPNNLVTLYKNASSFATITLTGNESADIQSTPFFVGGRSTVYLDGQIDEIGAWSRALTSAELTQLYNGGTGLQYPYTVASPSRRLALLGIG